MADPVTPETTVAIITGASQFPKWPGIAQGQPFVGAANGFRDYLLDADGFGLPQANLLDLFDSEDEASKQILAIKKFLRDSQERGAEAPRDLLFYYVGHGGFTEERDYFLAVKATAAELEGGTSVRMSDLARVIKREGGAMRRFVILDCCFSAAAYEQFQGSGPAQFAREQTNDALADGATPGLGTSLLCSSSRKDVSIALKDAEHTMFSGAMLHVLREGIPRIGRSISLAALGEHVRSKLRSDHGSAAVRPEVLSPDQREDELKDVALFPNLAHRRRNFDCNITITDDRTLILEYVTKEGKPARVEGNLGTDQFAPLAVQRLHDWVNIGVRLGQENFWRGQACEPDDLKLIGVNLYRILFGQPEVRALFMELYDRFGAAYHAEQRENESSSLRMHLRLIFHRKAEEIGRLPWEFLFVPGAEGDELNGSFFAGERTELALTRYVPVTLPMKPVVPKSEPLRIMVAIYTPTGEAGISTPERDALIAKMGEITSSIIVIEDASWQTLAAALRRERPHVFHFVGYGTLDEKGKHGGLALVGWENDPMDLHYAAADDKPILPYTGKDLLSLFEYDGKPGMVFLHACKTRLGKSTEMFRSQEALLDCARELVFAKIPAVVALQYGMPHSEIGAFASAMYKQLALGMFLDDAVKAGRASLGYFMPKWAHPRFGAPLVYLQSDEPMVMPSTAAREQEPAQERGVQITTPSAVGATPTRMAPPALSPSADNSPAPSPAAAGSFSAPKPPPSSEKRASGGSSFGA